MCLLQKKSDVYSVFTNFKLQIENLLSAKIKVVRTDGGGEFVNINFRIFFMINGITHQVVCPYIPAQNGVVERKNRHVIETVVALLQIASMPPKFWGETVLTAIYLINQVPVKVRSGDKPVM